MIAAHLGRALSRFALMAAVTLSGCTAPAPTRSNSQPAAPATRSAPSSAAVNPWCAVDEPLAWRNLGWSSTEPNVVHYFSDDMRWHVRFETPTEKTEQTLRMVQVPRFELPDGSFTEPFQHELGWVVDRVVFTDDYLVALIGEGDLTMLDFEIWAWDPANPGEAAWLVHKRQPDSVQGSFIRPLSHGNELTWLEPGPSKQEQSVPIYDLDTRELRFAAQDVFAYGPIWTADTLVWQQVIGDEQVVGLNPDGSRWQSPPQLAEMATAAEFTVSDGVWFWTNRNRSAIYTWQEGWDAPELVDRVAADGEWFDTMSTTDGFLFYYGHHQTWVADTTTRTRAPLTEQYGAVHVRRPNQISINYYGQDLLERYGAQQRIWTASELPRLQSCG